MKAWLKENWGIPLGVVFAAMVVLINFLAGLLTASGPAYPNSAHRLCETPEGWTVYQILGPNGGHAGVVAIPPQTSKGK